MDTLVDKRYFPQEMSERPVQPKEQKRTPWVLIILILFALGLIAFLVWNIFFAKNERKAIPKETISEEKKVEAVNNFQQSVQPLTQEERTKRLNSFFSN